MAASLSYFSLFAIIPVSLVTISIFNFFLSYTTMQDSLIHEIYSIASNQEAQTIETVILNTQKLIQTNSIIHLIGIASLIVGATTLFVQLQHTLNTLWEISDEDHHTVRVKVYKRIIALAFVLLSSVALFILSMITIFVSLLGHTLIGDFTLLQIFNSTVSIALLTVIFTLIFKSVPDAKISWTDATVGSLLTAIFFYAGRYVITLYVNTKIIGTLYGAAGSLLLLLIWLYYSSYIFIFGATFTKVYAEKCGSGIRPD